MNFILEIIILKNQKYLVQKRKKKNFILKNIDRIVKNVIIKQIPNVKNYLNKIQQLVKKNVHHVKNY